MTSAKTAILAATALAAIGIGGAHAAETNPSPQAEPDIDFRTPAVSWSGPQIAERASLLASTVPLPAGGNLNGVRWAQLETATDQDIRFIIQYNAACQWLRATADKRDPSLQQEVWNEIPQWPAMRLGHNSDQFEAARTAAEAGQPTPLLQQCRESHEREVAFANQQGLAPPQ